MRPTGFSTGALALGDFVAGIEILRRVGVSVVELSALREGELGPLVNALESLDLRGFDYISFHAPSKLQTISEGRIVELLETVREKHWPIVVHPDVIMDSGLWRHFGSLLCIENMDKRKAIGRTARELSILFEKLPDASLCLDLGHARQVDPSMSVAAQILIEHRGRLRQLHVSEVNTNSQHDALTFEAILGFSKVSDLVPDDVPVILESRVKPDDVLGEILRSREALHSIQALA